MARNYVIQYVLRSSNVNNDKHKGEAKDQIDMRPSHDEVDADVPQQAIKAAEQGTESVSVIILVIRMCLSCWFITE
ncbi:hypothetical protein DPMN_133243 [Dreissena polymorpha]|uniref:Uncharacterized protein n=1 Tax=Dreissena polymorpha TaxID=45954 RepID=A0A9D4J9L0_DREPO|nr:hypothetical protein DPMN_133243 [Dreissena polymorpha]